MYSEQEELVRSFEKSQAYQSFIWRVWTMINAHHIRFAVFCLFSVLFIALFFLMRLDLFDFLLDFVLIEVTYASQGVFGGLILCYVSFLMFSIYQQTYSPWELVFSLVIHYCEAQ